jgi:hypothetical protein
MGNLSDYFERNAYKPKYYIGDRVFGFYNKIPFIGTVGNDKLVSPLTGPEITVHLDLPILTENGVRSIIVVKHKQIKQILTDYDREETTLLRRRTT